MTNYWDFSANYFDKIGSSDLYGSVNAFFVPDRNGKNDSAVHFINGYISLPTGYYFKNTFSVTAWVKNNFTSFYRYPLVSFSNISHEYFNEFQWNSQNIKLNFASSYYVNRTCKFGISSTLFYSNISIWYHVAITYDGSKIKMYSNGTLSSTSSSFSLGFNSIKTTNYIGRFSLFPDWRGDFILDELKFFNRALNQTEIKNDMNLNN